MPLRSLKLAGVLLIASLGTPTRAQTAPPPQNAPTPSETDRPLPDIPTLMHEVETHQRASETIQKDYLYHEVATEQENDGHGGLKKNETTEYDVFWLNGVQVHKLIRKNGKDLSTDEQKKEDERLDKEVAKA
ncbi:MAG TPA: hypothetical protein VIX90_09985, partial [Edaphobacter sp.]